MNTQHVNFALKEAKMLSTLKHDSIVRYEDVFLEDAKASTATFPPCPLPADQVVFAVTGKSEEAWKVSVCLCLRVFVSLYLSLSLCFNLVYV